VSRFLLVVPPLVGHISPLIGVAAELRRGGHETAWAGPPEVLGRLVGPAARVYPTNTPPIATRPPGLRGFSALKYLWEDFLVPLAMSTVDGVTAAVRDFGADVVVADQQTLAGGLAAVRCGLPWVTSASTSAEFGAALEATPKIAQWRRDTLTDLLRRFTPSPVTGQVVDIYLSPHLVLVFSSRLLAGAGSSVPARFPAQVRFVGTSLGARPAIDFPWSRLRADRPIVYVTFGTANSSAAGQFLTECVAASRLVGSPIQVVVADPGGHLCAPAGDDVIVRPQVPQLDLLARASVVICHAGHNTVCEALSHGVPLVTAPIRDDQPVIAQQVTDVGAGVRVRFGRATATQLATAIETVLHDPGYAQRAQLVRESLLAAGGAARAARLLAAVASQGGSDDSASDYGETIQRGSFSIARPST
jgi:MGT family glycosyltransferase